MKVLFIPFIGGPPGHLIPLLALHRKLRDSDVESAFLVHKGIKRLVERVGVQTLDFDYIGSIGARSRGYDPAPFRIEVQAYGRFKPDVVVEDTNPTTYFAATMTGKPWISIHRVATFQGWQPIAEGYNHFMLPKAEDWPDVSYLGIPQPKTNEDLFNSDVKVVHGVRSVEVLPEERRNDSSYHFAGPLILEDDVAGLLGWKTDDPAMEMREAMAPLERFLEANACRKKAIVTLGTVTAAGSHVRDCIRYLIENDFATISTVELDDLDSSQRQRAYHANWLPLHYVCSKADLMVHHCGGGTYHYPIMHNVPAITVGTKWSDREVTARRLEELGASLHVPAPDECENFLDSFIKAVETYFNPPGDFYRKTREKIRALNEELEKAAAAFDFEEVLREAINRKRSRAGGTQIR